MWNFIKKILKCLFPWCFRETNPQADQMEPADPLLGKTAVEEESDHDMEAEAHISRPAAKRTENIQAILALEDADAEVVVAVAAPAAIRRAPSQPRLLTAEEKASIIAAASVGADAYLDGLDETKQEQATDEVMNFIGTSFKNISSRIAEIKTIAQAQQHKNYSQLSHVESLSTSWNTMSRDIMNHRNCYEKSISYRCNEVLSHATDSRIKQLVCEIQKIFTLCKTMLGINLFRKQSLARNLKDAHRSGEESATTSEGAFFNNANRRTKALLERFNGSSDEEDAKFAHETSVVQRLGK